LLPILDDPRFEDIVDQRTEEIRLAIDRILNGEVESLRRIRQQRIIAGRRISFCERKKFFEKLSFF
jgi:hypothetical protein